ncbi:ribonuclease P protein component [Draconibacterium orientale]|uniref:Ribonuclease P protein component n=1 Tax=Draconibacterium orientale TaxID=1168034 RepID=X5DVZ4_9BACT|nr:ribonuclease P protein component [Draconibacterium orientale]AHW59365.1 ribonuclease P [Draconibacterium orientale]SEU08910.1 ribonuclease P protein component [Draconibacterium orientale]
METKEKTESPVAHTLKKAERLCSKKVIDELFAEGESFLAFPIKVVYKVTELPQPVPVQAGFTVSKKIFKRAVKRNRIKRLMREAYRLNKQMLPLLADEQQMAIFFIFIGKELPTFAQVEKAMKKALYKLAESSKKAEEKA